MPTAGWEILNARANPFCFMPKSRTAQEHKILRAAITFLEVRKDTGHLRMWMRLFLLKVGFNSY